MKLGIALPEGAGLGTGDLLAAVDALPAVPSHVPVWCRWGDPTKGIPGSAFPFALCVELIDRGIRPVIFWEPTGVALDDIAEGHFDRYLEDWAATSHRLREPVIVRFAHEQNTPWMPWGVLREGNDAASYVAAWRHMARRTQFRSDRIRLLWCPDASHVRWIAPTWPGEAFVDLVGLDGYRWPDKPRSPSAIFGPALAAVRRLTTLPLIVAEFGVSAQDPARSRWLGNAIRWFRAHGVHAAIYFDIDMRWNGRHPDWRLGDLGPRWEALAA